MLGLGLTSLGETTENDGGQGYYRGQEKLIVHNKEANLKLYCSWKAKQNLEKIVGSLGNEGLRRWNVIQICCVAVMEKNKDILLSRWIEIEDWEDIF